MEETDIKLRNIPGPLLAVILCGLQVEHHYHRKASTQQFQQEAEDLGISSEAYRVVLDQVDKKHEHQFSDEELKNGEKFANELLTAIGKLRASKNIAEGADTK